MRILFFVRHVGYTRNFESTLRLLAQRGHEVHLSFDIDEGHKILAKKPELRAQTRFFEKFCEENPSVSFGRAPGRERWRWGNLARDLGATIDYLRYLEPCYRDAPKLRRRAEVRANRFVRWLVRIPQVSTAPGLRLLHGVLHLLERALPTNTSVDNYIRRRRPDVVLVTPLVESVSPQVDYIRSAKALGVRTALCVASWDNLTNKGLVREIPDLVTVWNEPMQREAVELHRIPPERVVITGAVPYDHWFEWRPSTTREQFCERVGLPAERQFLLYLCSSPFIAPPPVEVKFVQRWLEWLRSCGDPGLREVGVLIRPHPQNAAQWREIDFSALGPVAIWPRAGADPYAAGSKAEYFDSIYHCAAGVGVNTSALIESAIVGRRVFTVLAPEFRDTQEGTLHFSHLLHANGGPLSVARSLDEHTAQLHDVLDADEGEPGWNRGFVEMFIRPRGLDVPSAPTAVEAVERLGQERRPAPQSMPFWLHPVRWVLWLGLQIPRVRLFVRRQRLPQRARRRWLMLMHRVQKRGHAGRMLIHRVQKRGHAGRMLIHRLRKRMLLVKQLAGRRILRSGRLHELDSGTVAASAADGATPTTDEPLRPLAPKRNGVEKGLRVEAGIDTQEMRDG